MYQIEYLDLEEKKEYNNIRRKTRKFKIIY